MKVMLHLRDHMKIELEKMDLAAQSGAWPELGMIAHKMISSCMFIRSPAVPTLLRSLQVAAESGDGKACREKLERIRPYIDKIFEEAGAYLAGRSAPA